MTRVNETWVLLRGLARESAHWGSFPNALKSPNRKILLLDSPGNGLRNHEPSPLTVRETAEILRAQALKERVPESSLHIFALSMGGMVAAEWMAAHPGEVQSAVLVNSSFRGLSPLQHRLRPGAWAIFLLAAFCPVMAWRETLILRLISNRCGSSPSLLEEWIRIQRERPTSLLNAIRQLFAAARFSAPSPPSAATRIKILGAKGDRLCHWRCSEAIASHWKAELRLHPSAGHDLPIDDPGWVIEQLRD